MYKVMVHSEIPLTPEEIEDNAWYIMESTHIKPTIEDAEEILSSITILTDMKKNLCNFFTLLNYFLFFLYRTVIIYCDTYIKKVKMIYYRKREISNFIKVLISVLIFILALCTTAWILIEI